MVTKMATSGPHAAGIFADMTVDGPEIGTLVLVVDRAKNLPNRKTMGKQSAYCAARLGKEARKTETDRRGGQTPKWDQELRFTVHDSPDYYNLKISAFSEDKRTDLIGEAWVGLNDVVVPGGGKADLWQTLNCKGKYAGDLRIELTYYDSREKPVKGEEIVSVAEELRQQYGSLQPKVKRRPLPTNPNAPVTTEVVIPERAPPGRAKHGPRDLQMHARANSMPPQTFNYPHSAATLTGHTPLQQEPPQEQGPVFGEYDANPDPEVYDPYAGQGMQQPDFLPQLPPSNRQRGLPAQPRFAQRQQTHPAPMPQQYHPQPRPASHIGVPSLPHSHSAPAAPVMLEEEHGLGLSGYHTQSNWPEQIPDVEYQYQHIQQRRNDVPPGWEQEYGSAYPDQQPYVEDEPSSPPPPPPPMHSNSSPAVPNYASTHPYQPSTSRYGATPPASRPQYMQGSSPIQSIEHGFSPIRSSPNHVYHGRTGSMDDYGSSPYQRSYGSTPNLTPPHQASSPTGRTPPFAQTLAGRRSFVDPNTPTRPHPLSQQVPRARSPMPYHRGASEPPQDYQGRAPAPRALSPQPPMVRPSTSSKASKSTFSIQFPVRAFESSDDSPLSTSQPTSARPLPNRATPTPTRKSVSPRPSFGESPSIPFSPDSFDVHRPASDLDAAAARQTASGPIVGWHGQEIDPSDHLPVEAWAPEPIPKGTDKVGPKTYGLGRDRDFGPRTAVPSGGGRMGKDTVINVRLKAQSQPPAEVPQQQPPQQRNRLVKKAPTRGQSMDDFHGHEGINPVPNPYDRSYAPPQFQQLPPNPFARGGRETSAPPSVPPKVPLNSSPYGQPPFGQMSDDYGADALSREIESIDLGRRRGERMGSAPPETGGREGGVREARFVPVRSHRERW